MTTMTTHDTTTSIAIIGSGLAALSTAICLEKLVSSSSPSSLAITITIYERDEFFASRPEGYGLTLKYDPKGILGQLGVLDNVSKADCPSRSHYLLNSKGFILGYYGNAFLEGRGYGQRGNLRVPRQQVRRILLDKLQKTEIVWGYKLTGLYKTQMDDTNNNKMTCIFENGESVIVDWVIGADGIRSTVLQCLLPETAPPLRPLGIRLIVGLCDYPPHINGDDDNNGNTTTTNSHACLLHERGFYTLHPAHRARLFVMPYSAPSTLHPNRPRRYMWQLSFASCPSENDLVEDQTPEMILQQALEKCREWHDPVLPLLQSTPLNTLWSSHLYDRDPHELYLLLLKQLEQDHPKKNESCCCKQVLLVGDALHPMSCFKGQGAHQALKDGACVAKWLDFFLEKKNKKKCSAMAAVKNCMREMVQRTAPIVEASRLAAHKLHSLYQHQREDHGVLGSYCSDAAGDSCSCSSREPHVFAGVHNSESVGRLIQELRDRGIRAGCHDKMNNNLDESIRNVMHELGLAAATSSSSSMNQSSSCSSPSPPDDWVLATLEAAQSGNTARLRELSWAAKDPQWMRQLVDPNGNTCVHLAIKQAASTTAASFSNASATAENHDDSDDVDVDSDPIPSAAAEAVQWLVTEAGCDCRTRNHSGQTPYELAETIELQGLLEKLMKLQQQQQ